MGFVRTIRLLAASQLLQRATAFVEYGDVSPAKINLGSTISLDATTPYTNHSITLTPSAPFLTIDYGTETAGFPFVDVISLSGPSQIEVKYSEQYHGLLEPQSDGPWVFFNGLSNTFRVETFNLTTTGRSESFFIQGGQRWETVRLLTNTSITFSAIGMNSTAARVSPSNIPATFTSSNGIYDEIYNLGARCVEVACVDAGNAVSTFEITSDGVLLRNQQASLSIKSASFANYTMSFMTKIVRSGTGWKVAAGIGPYGASFILTSDYPTDHTLLNTNRTLVPPNTLVFNYGWWIVNQTTLESGWNQYFPLQQTIKEDQWYNISTTLTATGYNVTLDGTSIAFVPVAEAALLAATGARFGSGSPTAGSFGFGPFQDEIAYVKDVVVVANNGTELYRNDMTSNEVLAEYSVQDLQHSICMDGAKRDRLVWIGDFYHTARIILASTRRTDYLLGTVGYGYLWQMTEGPFAGFVPISPQLGSDPANKDAFTSQYGGLIDYQDLFLSGIGNYFRATGDSQGLSQYWPNIKAQVSRRLTYIDPVTGLMAGEDAFYFLGPVNGSAATALSAYTLRLLVPLAEAFKDMQTATLWNNTAKSLSAAINRELWNPELGVYSLSLTDRGNFSLTSIAWTILSGTANATQAASMVAKMDALRLGVGYKTISSDPNLNTTNLSPNTCGFLLDAVFKAHRDLGVQNLTVAKTLLDDFWSKMVTVDEYYSGTSWEYLYAGDGAPGLDLFTSLAHPWGGAPTYVLPEYVLGIAATSPGYKTWVFAPVLNGLGLEHAEGTVVTPYGDINASWQILGGGVVVLSVNVPAGTQGTLVLPNGNVEAECDGRKHRGGKMQLSGSGMKKITMHQW
ncbi:hypothetical protein LTR86_009209 [Recurvomyces mirabilis]|nr:hypothetical protein LTR86_009209 [Recurvomyces mirabilis]